jgi:hypothetical protein
VIVTRATAHLDMDTLGGRLFGPRILPMRLGGLAMIARSVRLSILFAALPGAVLGRWMRHGFPSPMIDSARETSAGLPCRFEQKIEVKDVHCRPAREARSSRFMPKASAGKRLTLGV